MTIHRTAPPAPRGSDLATEDPSLAHILALLDQASPRTASTPTPAAASWTLPHPSGGAPLTLRAEGDGWVMAVGRAALRLSPNGVIGLECEGAEFRARDRVAVAVGGDMVVDVEGDRRTRIGRTDAADAGAIAVEARTGDVVLRALDDVRVDGARVLLNCDDPSAIPPGGSSGPGWR